MNIKEELENLNCSTNFGADVIKQVVFQQKELDEKLHLLKIVSLANQVESKIHTDLFSNEGIQFLQLYCAYDHEEGYKAEFYLLDSDKGTVAAHYDALDSEAARVIYSMFEELGIFDFELISQDLKSSQYFSLELKAGIKDEIIELLLNKELKKVYDYNMMQVELPNSVENNSKKFKM